MGPRWVHLRVHVGVPVRGSDQQPGDVGAVLSAVAVPLPAADVLPSYAG